MVLVVNNRGARRQIGGVVIWGLRCGGTKPELVCWGCKACCKAARAICGYTNHRNKGLISVNRRTSLLSHVQYPVPIKVVYKGFNALSARKATKFGVGPEPIATREHREQIYRRFPA